MITGNLKTYLVGALAIVLLVSGCDKKKEEAVQAPASQEQAAAPAQLDFPIKGKADEVLTGGGFSYIRLGSGADEMWIAVPETEVKAGETVEVTSGQMMANFPSKTLDRTFAKLLVASELVGKAPKGAGSPHGMPNDAPTGAPGADTFGSAMKQESAAAAQPMGGAEVTMGSSKAIVPFADLKVEKASGANGYTVGEVFGKAASLNGKKVRVRGQVMKVSAGIMGRNWLHIQDGTGNPTQNTHDLVVTSAEQPEKGAIVMVEGVMAANKDFGAGYVYSVIVEEAKILK